MKKKNFKLVALMLIMMVLSSLMPMTSFAATSLTLDTVANIMPGGMNVAYNDNASAGGSVRGLETSGSLGVCLRNQEFITYDISALDPGIYQMSVISSNTGVPQIKVSLDGEVIMPKVGIVVTGSYSTQKEFVMGDVEIKAGAKVLRLDNTANVAVYIAKIKFQDYASIQKRKAFLAQSRPYKMSYLPCIIEAENFDSGAQGIAYTDSDKGNIGGEYRTELDADIYKTGNKYYVNMTSGDWMAYTIQCDITGNYDLVLNYVDAMETSKVRAYMDGYEILRVIPDNKNSVGEMKEVSVGTYYIKEGTHTFYIKCIEGDVNLDYVRFRKSKNEGIDISDTANLRTWAESQELSEEDYAVTEEVINPVEHEIYVDASLTVDGDGSKEKPFNKLQSAKEYVKTVNDNMKGDIVVNLKGDFKIDETLMFNEEDSGSGIYNVIYRGDGETSIHGGRKITGWKQAEGTPLWQVKVPDSKYFRQFYVGDNRAVRAKTEWLYWMVGDYDDPKTNYSNAEGYYINANDFPMEFSKPADMEMIWMPSWKNIRMPIDSMEYNDDGTILVKYPQPYFDAMFSSSTPMSNSIPYYLENAPEFLDRPGEFYFDKDTKLLTYYPFSYEDMTTIDCYIPETEFLMNFSGTDNDNKVKNITFEGIEFKYGAWYRTNEKGFSTVQADEMNDPDVETDQYQTGVRLLPAQIQVHYGDNINFKKNEFKHLGSAALSYNNSSTTSLCEGNLFDDISATVITFGDWRVANNDPLERYTRKISFKNNLIRRASVEYMTPVITGYYVNNIVIDHNDVLDSPYTTISMGWGWGKNNPHSAYNRMTNNKLVNGTYKLMDGGHIYTLDPMKGGVISGNYIKKAGEWKGAIYHDNSSAYIRTFNNVFEDVPKWYKITWNTVRDNIAYNNYSERPHVNTYADQNSTEPAKGKVNGEWPEEAKQIIANAGLQDDYKYILEEYNKKENLRNATLERQKYQSGPGIFIEAGNFMEGGEGVGYHDILGNANGRSVEGEPSVYESYDGTGMLYIMVTIQGEWTKHKFNIEEAGEYEVFTQLAVVGDSTAVTVEVDGKEVAKELKLEPNCKSYEKFTDYSVGTVYLEPGEHVVKVEHAIGNFGYKAVRIAKVGEELNRNDGFNSAFIDACLGK